MGACRTVGPVLLTVVLTSCGGSAPELPKPPPLASPVGEPCVPPPPPAENLVHQRLASPVSSQDEKAIRAALEHRFEGMSGAGSFVGVAPSASAVEEAALEEMKKCVCCRQVPFGAANDEWVAFKTSIRAGDFLVYFRNNNERWRVLGGAEGYVIVRNGQIVRLFYMSMN